MTDLSLGMTDLTQHRLSVFLGGKYQFMEGPVDGAVRLHLTVPLNGDERTGHVSHGVPDGSRRGIVAGRDKLEFLMEM